ncbi:hypothetical protein [Thiolinea disciformis]|uniref:hypothetical protein n=1 Tax=Thiolinea disciformis TaxID=125614 RepID=UPI00036B7DB3|nr:hypothetical protein [Thiolinea disciformis]
MKHYIHKILSYSMVGSLGFTIVAGLQGCDSNNQQAAPAPKAENKETIADAAASEQGVFMVIKQTGANPDTYELLEKYPSSEGTRAILKKMDGTEQILSEADLKKLAEEEAKRVEAGESKLTQEATAQNQGLSLGETILASAAGALIGGMIANKLMGNANYRQHQQQQAERARSTMSSTRNPAAGNTATQPRTQPRSGFFGGNQGSTTNSNSNSFGG